MIVAATLLAGLSCCIAYSGSKTIKDDLINRGFVLASGNEQFDVIFKSNKKYLEDYKINDKENLEKYCLDNLEAKVLFKSTFFFEKACALNVGEVIKRKNNSIVERWGFLFREYIERKDKTKQEVRNAINNDTTKWINWCQTNKAKPYSNETKQLENDVKVLCFFNW